MHEGHGTKTPAENRPAAVAVPGLSYGRGAVSRVRPVPTRVTANPPGDARHATCGAKAERRIAMSCAEMASGWRLPDLKAQSLADIEALLPPRLTPADLT